ncbi:MAG: diguanylate cyclase, partial [Gammaproteobacteria bacterium]|nr:diguanylate cyclase [Gammaproteobacteria bacterium]
MTTKRSKFFELQSWAPAGVMLVMVGALLAWHTDARYKEFQRNQESLMHSSVNGTAGEIGTYLTELRRSVHLFADSEKELLDKLRSSPDDIKLHDQLNQRVRFHFPEAFAFTLANRGGDPLLEDFDGLVGEVCQHDIKQFATDRAHSEIYVHPNSDVYHFDIMVDWDKGGAAQGIFFVSFPADLVARTLRRGQIPGHRLMLLNRNIPGLIEIADIGPRILLKREFKLSPEEMRHIDYSLPVAGSSWNLVDLPEAGLFENARRSMVRDALLVMGAFLSVTIVMMGLLYLSRKKTQELDHLYRHDPVTGLPNRYFLLEHMQELIDQAKRRHMSFSLLFLDIGDARRPDGGFFDRPDLAQVLQSAAVRVQATLGERDTLVRLTGNEFAVLSEDVS